MAGGRFTQPAFARVSAAAISAAAIPDATIGRPMVFSWT
jgi:hypothetical protein